MIENCDLCDGKAEYLLCQQHLDIMRFPDVFSTADGEYPDAGAMVLWGEIGGDTYIGGYVQKYDAWFTQDDAEDGLKPTSPILWCNLPSLEAIYQQENALRGKQEAQ
jgi:hypothetical protein